MTLISLLQIGIGCALTGEWVVTIFLAELNIASPDGPVDCMDGLGDALIKGVPEQECHAQDPQLGTTSTSRSWIGCGVENGGSCFSTGASAAMF